MKAIARNKPQSSLLREGPSKNKPNMQPNIQSSNLTKTTTRPSTTITLNNTNHFIKSNLQKTKNQTQNKRPIQPPPAILLRKASSNYKTISNSSVIKPNPNKLTFTLPISPTNPSNSSPRSTRTILSKPNTVNIGRRKSLLHTMSINTNNMTQPSISTIHQEKISRKLDNNIIERKEFYQLELLKQEHARILKVADTIKDPKSVALHSKKIILATKQIQNLLRKMKAREDEEKQPKIDDDDDDEEYLYNTKKNFNSSNLIEECDDSENDNGSYNDEIMRKTSYSGNIYTQTINMPDDRDNYRHAILETQNKLEMIKTGKSSKRFKSENMRLKIKKDKIEDSCGNNYKVKKLLKEYRIMKYKDEINEEFSTKIIYPNFHFSRPKSSSLFQQSAKILKKGGTLFKKSYRPGGFRSDRDNAGSCRDKIVRPNSSCTTNLQRNRSAYLHNTRAVSPEMMSPVIDHRNDLYDNRFKENQDPIEYKKMIALITQRERKGPSTFVTLGQSEGDINNENNTRNIDNSNNANNINAENKNFTNKLLNINPNDNAKTDKLSSNTPDKITTHFSLFKKAAVGNYSEDKKISKLELGNSNETNTFNTLINDKTFSNDNIVNNNKIYSSDLQSQHQSNHNSVKSGITNIINYLKPLKSNANLNRSEVQKFRYIFIQMLSDSKVISQDIKQNLFERFDFKNINNMDVDEKSIYNLNRNKLKLSEINMRENNYDDERMKNIKKMPDPIKELYNDILKKVEYENRILNKIGQNNISSLTQKLEMIRMKRAFRCIAWKTISFLSDGAKADDMDDEVITNKPVYHFNNIENLKWLIEKKNILKKMPLKYSKNQPLI